MFNRLLRPAADSVTSQRNKEGDVPYAVLLNLIWAFWFFGDLMYGRAPSDLWIAVTAVGFVSVIGLWVLAMTRSTRLLMRYTLAMAALGYLVLPVNHSGGSCCFIYSCALLAHQGTVRSSLTMMAAVATIFVIETIWLEWPWAVIVSMLSVTLAVGGGNLARRANEKKNAEIRLSHDEVRRLAGLAERERIGRDLHDLLGHTLSLITLKSELANKLFDRDAAAAKREMADVERVARDALAQVRRAVTGIRAAGFAAELASAKLLLESNGIALTYTLAEVALPVDVETVLAMAVREAVTNIQRHARATQVEVGLEICGDNLQLRVADNGRGGAIVPGNGLTGMRERLATIDAQLRVESQRGTGTMLLVSLPLRVAHAVATVVPQTLRSA